MRQLLSETNKCELCGNRRGLEVHHIIPRVAGGPDEIDNMIVVCSSCHAKLTPRSALAKYGIRAVRYRNVVEEIATEFYRAVDKEIDIGFSVRDVLDIFDRVCDEVVIHD